MSQSIGAVTGESNAPRRATPTRFEWERALRHAPLPRHLKFFLLLLGTYMNHDGGRCFPTAKEMAAVGGWSRQRVFELFRDATAAGWIVDEKRSGHATVRVPNIPPNPVDNPTQHTEPTLVKASDPSDQGGQIHLTPPSDPSDPTVTGQVQDRQGGTLPPRTPPANPAADATGNEPPTNAHDKTTDQTELATQPDTRARANATAADCPTCHTVLDPDGSCFICRTPGTHQPRLPMAYTGT